MFGKAERSLLFTDKESSGEMLLVSSEDFIPEEIMEYVFDPPTFLYIYRKGIETPVFLIGVTKLLMDTSDNLSVIYKEPGEEEFRVRGFSNTDGFDMPHMASRK